MSVRSDLTSELRASRLGSGTSSSVLRVHLFPLLRPPTIHSWTRGAATACDPSVVGQTNGSFNVCQSGFASAGAGDVEAASLRGRRSRCSGPRSSLLRPHILTHLFSLLSSLHAGPDPPVSFPLRPSRCLKTKPISRGERAFATLAPPF